MPKPSPIDAHPHLLGVESDANIAKLAGVSVSAVYQYRRALGIGVVKRSTTKTAPTQAKAVPMALPKPVSRKRGRGLISKLDAHVDLLGVIRDIDVAKRVGVSHSAVRQYRVRHGIPSVTASKGKTRAAQAATPSRPVPAPKLALALRKSKLDAFVDVLGVLQDAEVARRAGVTREAVRQYKIKRGITSKGVSSMATPTPAGPRSTPKPPASGKTMPADVMCWRITLSDGGVVHLAARTVQEAANKAHAGLGDHAVGVQMLGLMYPP